MKISNEAKIGMLVLVVIAILAALTWKAGDYQIRREGYRVQVRFKNIDGVELNAPVTLNGFQVGRVEDIRIIYDDETFVQLTLWLDKKARIRGGARAYVKNMGFLGEKYVGLTFGDEDQPFLEPGAVILGREPGSFEQVMAEGEEMIKNLREISSNIKERLEVNSEHIDGIIADLRGGLSSMRLMAENMNERLEINKERIDDMIFNLNASSRNLEEMSYDLKINPWKLLYKESRRLKPPKVVETRP